MRGWWWNRSERVEGADKKKSARLETLHFSEYSGGTSLCGLAPETKEMSQFNKASQPGGVLPTSRGKACAKCADAVIYKATK